MRSPSVPPVSIMSSMSTQVRPSTAPTTWFATATLCVPLGRCLSTNASSDSMPCSPRQFGEAAGELAAAGVGRDDGDVLTRD